MVEDDLFDTPDMPTNDLEFDHLGRYLLPVPGRATKQARTRVTTYVKTISDTYTLNQWHQRMVAVGLSKRPDLLALAGTHPDDRRVLNDVCDRAREHAGATVRRDLGTALHAMCEITDLWIAGGRSGDQPPVHPRKYQPEHDAYVQLMQAYGLHLGRHLIERVVINDDYNLAGKFDRVVTADRLIDLPGYAPVNPGDRLVLDLKTGRDLGYSWVEIAGQLCAYATAGMMWVQGTDRYEPMPDRIRQDIGLVVHVPVREDQDSPVTATLYVVDLLVGADLLRLSRQVRALRRQNRHAAAEVPALTPDRQPVRIPDPDTIRICAIRSASTVAELAKLARDAQSCGQLTQAVRDAGSLRYRQLTGGDAHK